MGNTQNLGCKDSNSERDGRKGGTVVFCGWRLLSLWMANVRANARDSCKEPLSSKGTYLVMISAKEKGGAP